MLSIEGAIYADLTDMMHHLAGNTIPSGIRPLAGPCKAA
jgi:hypothetical protein